MEQTAIAQLAQNAVTALNSLILADELISQPRAIFKIVRFKEWLKQTVQDVERTQGTQGAQGAQGETDADELGLFDSDNNEAQTSTESDNKPETIKFD